MPFPLRDELRYWLWLTKAKAVHLLGRHTMVPSEIWQGNRILIHEKQCWLCPHREPLP